MRRMGLALVPMVLIILSAIVTAQTGFEVVGYGLYTYEYPVGHVRRGIIEVHARSNNGISGKVVFILRFLHPEDVDESFLKIHDVSYGSFVGGEFIIEGVDYKVVLNDGMDTITYWEYCEGIGWWCNPHYFSGKVRFVFF
jgi:hypothetical protein